MRDVLRDLIVGSPGDDRLQRRRQPQQGLLLLLRAARHAVDDSPGQFDRALSRLGVGRLEMAREQQAGQLGLALAGRRDAADEQTLQRGDGLVAVAVAALAAVPLDVDVGQSAQQRLDILVGDVVARRGLGPAPLGVVRSAPSRDSRYLSIEASPARKSTIVGTWRLRASRAATSASNEVTQASQSDSVSRSTHCDNAAEAALKRAASSSTRSPPVSRLRPDAPHTRRTRSPRPRPCIARLAAGGPQHGPRRSDRLSREWWRTSSARDEARRAHQLFMLVDESTQIG